MTVPIDVPREKITYSYPLRNQPGSFRSSSLTVHSHIPDLKQIWSPHTVTSTGRAMQISLSPREGMLGCSYLH